MRVLVVGLGAIGHAIVSSISKDVQVDVITTNGDEIHNIYNNLGDNHDVTNSYSYDNIDYIDHDYILVCLPFRQKATRLNQLKNKISKNSIIALIPGNQGALYYVPKNLRENNKIILLERVPQISRVIKQNIEVKIFANREELQISGINNPNYEEFRKLFIKIKRFNVYENSMSISLISSNATLHTSRIYDLYKLNNRFGKEVLFYENWTDEASDLFCKLEDEVLELKNVIDENLKIYDMYTHFKIKPSDKIDAKYKISTFDGFQGITFYIKDIEELKKDRFLYDDAILGMYFFLKLAEKHNVDMPIFRKIHEYALNLIGKPIEEFKLFEF